MLSVIKVHCVLKLVLLFISKKSLGWNGWPKVSERHVQITVPYVQTRNMSPLLPQAPKCCRREPQPECEHLQTVYPASFLSLGLWKSCNFTIGNWKLPVMVLSACPVLATVSARLAWQHRFIYFYSHAVFLRIFWWMEFTKPTNKISVVLLNGKSLMTLVWIWKGYAFQNSHCWVFKCLWKRAVVTGRKCRKMSVFFYCVLKCKLMMFVWPQTRRL